MSNSTSRWFLSIVAALCVVTLIGVPANASLQLQLDTGSGYTLLSSVPSGTPTSVSGTQGGIDYVLLAGTSNSPGASPQATLNISALSITNSSGAAATVKVMVGDTGFTFPAVGPVSLSSGFGGSITNSVVNSVSFQTWIDSTNTQNGQSGITSGLISLDTSGLANGASFNKSNFVAGNLGSSPYSLTGEVIISLAAGATVNLASSAVVAAVPEATSLIIWAGLGLVSFAAGRRNRG